MTNARHRARSRRPKLDRATTLIWAVNCWLASQLGEVWLEVARTVWGVA